MADDVSQELGQCKVRLYALLGQLSDRIRASFYSCELTMAAETLFDPQTTRENLADALKQLRQ